MKYLQAFSKPAHFLFFGFIFFFVFSENCEAARSLSISGNKSSLFGDEEMTVTASASGFTTGETVYIKGAFYQDGTTNYFGYTKKVDAWVKNGESAVNQRQVIIGDWDGTLIVKSDFLDSGYRGEGDYKFKVGFYYITTTGNISSSVSWSSNILALAISEPDPTPSPTPSPLPTPTSTKTPTPTSAPAPTATPTPTVKPTLAVIKITPIIKKTPTPAPKKEVLGEKTRISPTPTEHPTPSPTIAVKGVSGGGSPLAKVLIGLGVIFLISCGILWYQMYRKNRPL